MATEAVVGTRAHILAAAEQLIRDRGLKGCTTRAIAEIAQCAEGSIYRYFPDKHALFMEVMANRFPTFTETMLTLPDRAGTSTVRRHLQHVVQVAFEFYQEILPMMAGFLAEHKLLVEQRRYFQETKRGPVRTFGLLAQYIRNEQRLGRINEAASPDHVTRVLLGACWAQAFLVELLGEDAWLGSPDDFAKGVVRVVMDDLSPKQHPAPRTAGRVPATP